MSTEAQRESVKEFLDKFKQHAPSTMDPPSFPSDFLPPAREVPATPPAKLTLNFYMPHEIEYEGAEVDSIQLPAVTGDMGVLPGHVPTVAQLRPGVVAVNMDDKETKKVRRDVLQITPGFIQPRTRRDPSRLRVSARHPPAPKETLSFLWRHGQIVTFLSNQPRRTNEPTLTAPFPPLRRVQQYFVSSGFAFVHANSVTDVMAVEAVPVEQLDGEAVKKALADYQAKLVNAKDDYEKAAAQIGIEVTQAMESAVTGKA